MIHILDEMRKRYEADKRASNTETQIKLIEELQTPDFKEEFDEFMRFILFDLNKYDRRTLLSRWRQHKNLMAIRSQD